MSEARYDRRVPATWYCPTGVPTWLDGPCMAMEGNPNTFVAYEKSGGWASFSAAHLPADAVLVAGVGFEVRK